MHYEHRNRGTCSQMILIDTEGDIIKNVEYIGGCHGNTQGISRLVVGMNIDDVIERCKGIQCRAGTSCPDQLAQALMEMKAAEGAGA